MRIRNRRDNVYFAVGMLFPGSKNFTLSTSSYVPISMSSILGSVAIMRFPIPASEIYSLCSLLMTQPSSPLAKSSRTSHVDCSYLLPMPFCTAGRAAIRSIHFNRCGNGSISALVKPVRSQPFTHGHAFMSAMEYLPLPLPARYSRGSPVYLPLSRISSTP